MTVAPSLAPIPSGRRTGLARSLSPLRCAAVSPIGLRRLTGGRGLVRGDLHAVARGRSRFTLRSLSALALLVTVIAGCNGQPGKEAQSSSASTYARKELGYLQGLDKSNQFSGSVLVAAGGRLLLRSAVGFADWNSKRLNRPDNRFRIGSITKAFTATGVMLLVQDGRLKLEDTACPFVADCPGAWRSVTVRNLLTHTSGIPDYLPSITLAQFNAPTPPPDLLALVANRPLSFSPGSEYGYSNTNYVLLGLIIENLSGLSYGAYLEQRIFRPLSMTGSGYERDFTRVPNSATGFNAAFERHLGPHVTVVVLSNFYWAASSEIASLLANQAPKSQ